jgi:hypothetical protein
MAPEQCGGEPVGPAADIYSLGCIVYQMLAGSPVFAGKAAHLLTQHMFTEPEPLDRRNPAVPSRVAEVVMWALRKDAAERPATAGLFAGALRAKSESALGLVRRGLVLALEHLPVFVGATAALLAPYFAVLAATLAVDGLRHGGVVGPDTAAFALRVLFVAELATLMLAAILTRGVSLLVIAQILLAPLKRVRIAFALEALRRLLWPSLQGVAAWALLFVVPTLLAIACARAAGALLASGERVEAVTLALAAVASAAVGFKYLCDTLQLAGVILAEGLGLRAALGRSRELARRIPADTRLVAAINVGLAALPIALGPELEALRETFAGAAATIVALAVYRLLVTAVMAVLVGVLYFKQREANAESVESLLGPQQPTARETSKWQQRLDLSLMSLRASGSQPDLPGADSGAERAG